ncbi:MAG: class I SAM-dependent methyltransferase [Phycisphaerales bacterium]
MSRTARTPVALGASRRRQRPDAFARRLTRLRRRVRDAVGAILHLPRTWTVEGVRYRECTREPLTRALAPTGEGVKEYDVRFPGLDAPPPMTIRFTRTRRYADLAASARLPAYRALDQTIRPGQRVFELGCGVAKAPPTSRHFVGPSGGVVAVGTDRESIRYARRRYRSPQLGYEHGGAETLAGELDGSFDTVLMTDAPSELTDDPSARHELLAELWRVVAPGGALILCETAPSPRAPGPAGERLGAWLLDALEGVGSRAITPSGGGVCVVATKPESAERPPGAS